MDAMNERFQRLFDGLLAELRADSSFEGRPAGPAEWLHVLENMRERFEAGDVPPGWAPYMETVQARLAWHIRMTREEAEQ
jgi:hypothetical protein